MEYEFLIDGESRHYAHGTYPVYDPADLSVIAEIPDAKEEDVAHAVAAAKEAYYREWRFFAPEERQKLFWRFADIMESYAEEIGAVADREGGLVGRADGIRGEQAGMVRFYANFINTRYGDVLSLADDCMNYVVKEPVGVVAAMVPWNSPLGGAVQKLAPALAVGNTVVLRCADEAPLATLMLARAVREAGFPRGVVNIIAGLGPDSGRALVEHPDVRLVSFTGSVATGKHIMQAAAKQMKRTVFELGGKCPLLVFADADLEAAAKAAITTAYVYQGQICCATSRVLVEESIRDAFLELLQREVAPYRPAYPLDGISPYIGPLFNEKQLQQVERYVEMGKRDGELLWGGGRITEGKFGRGFYYQPTAFLFPNDASGVCKEEIFGPVLSVVPFADLEEGIHMANDVRYGLASSVWSKDLQTVNTVIRRLESGTVWVNGCFQFSLHSPWGGYKESGIGREYGRYALAAYQEHKNVWLNP